MYMVQNESVLKKQQHKTQRAHRRRARVYALARTHKKGKFRDGEGKAIEINMISKNIMQSGGDRIMT